MLSHQGIFGKTIKCRIKKEPQFAALFWCLFVDLLLFHHAPGQVDGGGIGQAGEDKEHIAGQHDGDHGGEIIGAPESAQSE